MDGHSRMGARLRTEASVFYIASRCAQTYSPLPTGTILPFSKPDQLVCDLEPDRTAEPEQAIVPGQPLLALHDSTGVDKLLESELYAQDLETVVPRLWIITKFSSANINSLPPGDSADQDPDWLWIQIAFSFALISLLT
jgi:hypothetical protein